MNEALFVLEREESFLKECLKGWKSESHPEAFKQRNKKLQQIQSAINLIKNNL